MWSWVHQITCLLQTKFGKKVNAAVLTTFKMHTRCAIAIERQKFQTIPGPKVRIRIRCLFESDLYGWLC